MLTANSIYQELGVRQVIHAAGTKTTHGGTRMSAETLEAMRVAGQAFADVREVNQRVGDYIAQITGAEAGMVTSGAASGVVLSIAVCMTGTDIAKVRQLPNARGMRDQVVIQKIHRGSYSHMYGFTGASIVEIGDLNDTLPEELEAAINPQTAALAFLLGPRILKQGLSLPEMVAIGRKHGIPVIVDAAAMLPPRSNLRRYIDQGADLVTFSGGKMIHGPQNTGILCGRRDLVDACMANASPHHAIGRPHKVSKENMVGLYSALKQFMACDEDAQRRQYRLRLEPIAQRLQNIEGVEVSVVHDDINYNVPVAAITFTDAWRGPSGKGLTDMMLQGEPAVFMQYFPSLGHLVVNPVSLQAGEAEVVAMRLAALFRECMQKAANERCA